jgi:putative membrane protein
MPLPAGIPNARKNEVMSAINRTDTMNSFKSRILSTVSLTTILVTCLSLAPFNKVRADDTAKGGQFSSKDYKFVTDAYQAGNTEVSLGQMAQQKAVDQTVRDFSQRMVQDHQKANQELTQLISQKGATVPEASNKKDDEMTTHLQGLTGPDFDTAYIKCMVTDHKKAVKEFERAADKADDADLKAWAAKTLPTLQEHLRLAESAETTITSSKPQPGAP